MAGFLNLFFDNQITGDLFTGASLFLRNFQNDEIIKSLFLFTLKTEITLGYPNNFFSVDPSSFPMLLFNFYSSLYEAQNNN